MEEPGYEKRPMWRQLIVYLLIGGLAYIAVYYAFSKNKSVYAPETAPSALTTDNFTVTYGPNGFEPQNLTIKAGDTVIWINQGEAKMDVASSPHPAHTDYPALNFGLANTNESKSLSFPKPGTYKYHNHLNAGHYGLITVE
jgi:plastocyanin